MSPSTMSPLSSVKALAFDVFGTVVDWRTSVTEELYLRAYRKLSSPTLDHSLKPQLERLTEEDWGRFAKVWRDTYSVFTKTFDAEKHAWKSVDAHHLDSLIELLAEWGLEGLYNEEELKSLSLVWHRLRPWDDSAPGLAALAEQGLIISTLSNGNVSLLRDLNDFGNLGFQRLLCAETFRTYKPSPIVYQGAARELGVKPEEVAMVATHLSDLKAARDAGLKTIYVPRPQEEAWPEDDERYQYAKDWVDEWVDDEDGFEALARRFKLALGN